MFTIQSQKELQDLCSRSKYVILKLTAPWCSPCALIQPFYESLAQQYRFPTHFEFAIADIEAQLVPVQSIPTFVLFDEGRIVKQIPGDKKILEELVKEVSQRVLQSSGNRPIAVGSAFDQQQGNIKPLPPIATAQGFPVSRHSARGTQYKTLANF